MRGLIIGTAESNTHRKGKVKTMEQKKKPSMARIDVYNSIKRSWAWERLTEEEKKTFAGRMWEAQYEVKGSYEARWRTYELCFRFFLYGIGYNERPDWRNPYKEWAVVYKDGEEVSRFESYEDALHQVNAMWENDHTIASIVEVEAEVPQF